MTANSNTIYLLGAGFTRAFFPDAPLNKDLLEAIIKSGGNKLAEYRDKYKADGIETGDIEQLLTQIDLIHGNRTPIQEEISTFFTEYRFPKFKSPLPMWFGNFANEILQENDSIISLNYDCFLEGALDSLGVWSPRGGYACVSFPIKSDNTKNIKFFKIHGSENFVESEVADNHFQTSIGFDINESIYPRSGVASHIRGGLINRRPYIIAPSFVKIHHTVIATMMLKLLDISKTAKNLVIIGCGMRPEDNFLWLLLTRFLTSELEQRKRLIILDPFADEIWKKVSKYWVGSICDFADLTIIPCGLEHGIKTVGDILTQ